MATTTTSAATQVRIGSRVIVKDRNVRGTIRFSGNTNFSTGKWIGVELDEAVGKNNGSVAGRIYFLCDDDHGIFVRQNQIDVLSGTDSWSPSTPTLVPESPPKEVDTPSKVPPVISSLTPRERAKSLLVAPKVSLGSKPSVSPVSSPRPKRRVIPPKVSGVGQRQLDAGSKLKSGLEESTAYESSISPVIQMDEDVPEPWRSVIRDLNSKVQTLKSKRQDDRMKVKEGERNKLQVQQLMEQKTHLLELQGRIQVELKNSQKDTRTFQEQRAALQKRLQEVGEMVELATVDKELAEERAESLQVELSATRDKVEELSLDLEILQEEIRQSGPGVPVASVAMKQMDQQNNRLKEALVKVRDLLTTEQHGHKEALKELEKERVNAENLMKEKDNYKHQLEECEETIDLLKEQVDLNTSSERMIEILSDRNLEFEERIFTIQESLDDMEALKEIHDELEENQLAMERELREDLDIEINKKHQTETRLEQAQLTIADYQDTVEKFRNLVTSLQKDLDASRKEQESERSTREHLVSQSQAMLSLNLSLKASVTKGHSKAVDLELQKLDALQARKQVELLLQFLPSSFYIEGGEHDCVSLSVLLLRLQFKVQLLLDQLRQQNQLEKHLDKRLAILPQQAEQVVYISKLSLQIHKFGFLVNKLVRLLQSCGADKLTELGAKVQDISVHERCIDGLLDLYKQDQLDSAVQLDTLNRAISHLQVLTTDIKELPVDCHCELSDILSHIKQIEEANIIFLCCLKSYVQPDGDFISMMKGMETLSVDFMIYCGKLSRKIPFESKTVVKFFVSEELITKLMQYIDVFLKSYQALESGLSDIQEEALSVGETERLRDSLAHTIFNKAME
ncbi:Dynactin subunit 1-like isoform X4 [Oopsacas minuta]|uniref:Dynactin subunit 1 n=1 Tax=Oopsacas minuta TaxID=111878 RepID=A0AAV7K9D5_9METZ|nr:Dynactin subunit 1-like isoform X4 [Oopsacas minuta]